MWHNAKYFLPPVALLVAVFFAAFFLSPPAKAATIYITNSGDSLNTFRTNVNNSLTNINGELFGYPFPSNSTSTALTFSGGLSASTLNVSSINVSGESRCLNITSAGTVGIASADCGVGGGSSFAYPFPSNATSTLIIFGGGIVTTASSTLNASTTVSGALTALSGIYGSLTGNASTATTLAGNGSNASSGNAILGVDASGNAEGAFDVVTQAEGDASYQLLDTDLSDLAGLTAATGDIIYGAGSGNWAKRSAGTNGQMLALSGGVPEWVSTTTFSGGATYANGNVTVDLGTSIDISSETNFAVTSPIILTGDTVSIQIATAAQNGYLSSADFTMFNAKLGTTSIDTSAELAALVTNETGSGALVFGTSPMLSSTTMTGNTVMQNATTSTFAVTGVAGSLLKTLASGAVVSAVSGIDYAAFAYPFPSNATSTSIAFNNGLSASSATIAYASSTAVTVAGVASTTNLVISGITSASTQCLQINSSGTVSGTGSACGSGSGGISGVGPAGQTQSGSTITFATSTSGSDFTITAGADTILFSLPIASASNTGKLSATDWTMFNAKLGSTSIDTSAELAALVTDETGSGTLVFGTNATLSSTTLTGNTVLANATTSTFAITGVAGSLLKTLSSGAVVPAVAGTDYLASTFGYPFPSNATSTLISFNAGLTSASTTLSGSTVLHNATTTTLYVTSLTSALALLDANGQMTEYAGIDCTNQFVRDVSNAGAGSCATVTASDVSLANLTATDTTLTFSGTYNGSTARTIGVNQGANFVWTGNQDFGGAAFLEIPNGSNPTANDPGECAHDTTDNQIICDDLVVPTTFKLAGRTIASTSPAFISGGLMPLSTWTDGFTITRISCKVDTGTSKVIAIEDASGNSSEDITCGTTPTNDDGSITNATYTGDEEWYIDFGATSGTVDYVTITVMGVFTRE